ncbi:hypothetical protein [Janthinobacterium agaricidamnosum]|uniref:Uncharacterized protein n=1 Tax=Janthinobacterium agaricidamnosum NBRC 102515 = DSM 9628 TaxID=1349767 RepID=W0V4Y3_9BURK|nr:hypothetical protein [Janthinobacterium agaricidamnosum]CDG82660.1 hypothetical protein GJA_2024 [Janthinobacterium agaricidamnosum NBRC 102515 = DSM 9628]
MPIYVQHEVLGKVADVFNAEAIWQAPGLALFSRRPLLRDLLERSPREHKGRAATRCFSHVTLMLPQEEVDDDYHLTRGSRARDLAQTLTALHQKDFGDLLGADQVRYDVVGTETLDAGQVEVKFGHAVYLPAADEKVLYNVSVSRDSAVWQAVCPIYPNQRLALIGGDQGQASFAAGGWPFGPDGAVLLINDGPDAPVDVQMRPRDAFDCTFDAKHGYYTITSKRGAATPGGQAQRLLLKISRASAPIMVAPAPASRAAVWQSRPAPSTVPVPVPVPAPRTTLDDLEPTALPVSHRPAKPLNRAGESDATYAPIAQQRVSLVALALPRLSRYRDTGASALEIPFDRDLAISPNGEPAISFTVNTADELYASSAAGRQRIAAPASFTPLDARTIRLLAAAPEMADRYCAMLCLAEPVVLPVAGGARFVFGRNAPVLAALRLLDSPRFLQRSGPADGASADRIGLSRNAFSFEASPQGFKIGRLAAAQALYHLDQQLRFVASITDTDDETYYLLPPGHHLVAGHYVLRFDA